jgi:tetratricopeptide (TPR) repeat protein
VNRPRIWAFVIAGAALAYAVIALWRGWYLLFSGDPVLVVFGIAILVIPILGAWLIYREIVFGFAMQHMGKAMAASGELPTESHERLPSGRLPIEEADLRFQQAQRQVEAAPLMWQAWYRLGLAYDDARDRKRARAAMRQAWTLFTTPG